MSSNSPKSGSVSSFHELTALDSKKNPVDFHQYEGKVVLVVNVASKCGFTKQYAGLEKLHEDYGEKGLVVLGFPCNQFGSQEPGTEEEIVTFCSNTYGVKFPMMAKVDVNGDKEHPVYNWLKSKKSSLAMKMIKWNFEKFLVDKHGQVVDRWVSTTEPATIAKTVEQELAKN
jgi:glutathione peroxidase-family protein